MNPVAQRPGVGQRDQHHQDRECDRIFGPAHHRLDLFVWDESGDRSVNTGTQCCQGGELAEETGDVVDTGQVEEVAVQIVVLHWAAEEKGRGAEHDGQGESAVVGESPGNPSMPDGPSAGHQAHPADHPAVEVRAQTRQADHRRRRHRETPTPTVCSRGLTSPGRASPVWTTAQVRDPVGSTASTDRSCSTSNGMPSA